MHTLATKPHTVNSLLFNNLTHSHTVTYQIESVQGKSVRQMKAQQIESKQTLTLPWLQFLITLISC